MADNEISLEAIKNLCESEDEPQNEEEITFETTMLNNML